MKEVSLLELLQSGAHFGHTTSRWNPKVKPFLFATRNNIHILDLEKTRKALLVALAELKKIAQAGGTILFVGTKRQAKALVKQHAMAAGMPFVHVRWLGGTFTNFKTIQKTIRKLEKLQDLKTSGELERYTKKERLLIEREIEKLERLFEGTKHMKRLPEAIFVVDINYDDIPVIEARKSKVKVFGLIDTNSNPALVDFPIPCNDDAAKAIDLVLGLAAEAINLGKSQYVPVVPKVEAPVLKPVSPVAAAPAPAAAPQQ